MIKSGNFKISKISSVPKNFFGKNKNTEGKISRAKKALCEKSEKTALKKQDRIQKSFSIKKACHALCHRALSAVLSAFSVFKKGQSALLASFKKLIKTCTARFSFVTKKVSLSLAFSLGMICAMVIFMAVFCSAAYTVRLDGAEVGLVDEKGDFFTLVDEINNEFSKESNLNLPSPSFMPKLVLTKNLTPKDELKERIKSTSDQFLPAYTVTVDSVPVFSTVAADDAAEVLTQYKASNFSDGKNHATFLNDVAIKYIFVPKTMLKTKDSALEFLKDGKYTFYYAEEGENLEDISYKTGVTVEDIIKTNSIENPSFLPKCSLKIYTGKPYISIKTVATVDETVAVDFETIKMEDDRRYLGSTFVENEGKAGEKQVLARVTVIDGEEITREILSENVLSEPENRIELIGTREPPETSGTGDFVMPTMGTLTSRFGSRWGRNHDGIDISASEGTPIYAADNGVVICSEYNNGGYGELIEIDHQNGYKTFYAHCSKRMVNKGDAVAKGDLIGYVGNTGRSTGAHLHFEVRKDDVPCDPLEFVE